MTTLQELIDQKADQRCYPILLSDVADLTHLLVNASVS